MTEKEFYLYTHQELIQKIEEEKAKEKAEWYKKTFLTSILKRCASSMAI